MRHVLFLAWRHIRHNALKSVVLVLAISLTILLPAATHLLIDRYETAMRARARDTPLLIGTKGHRFDLLLHALYFRSALPGMLEWREVGRVRDTGHTVPVPLHARFTARGYPIVGTTPDYFARRGLWAEEGSLPLRIGDCVLGAGTARSLGLGPGDRLMSDPENVFDLAGAYPLNMRVTGVLAESGGPDDGAVFTDIKSAWIIEGLGHGHRDVVKGAPPDAILKRGAGNVVANEALVRYTEVTAANIDSFHFHGDISAFPVSCILAWPRDAKHATLLRGMYVGEDAKVEALVPVTVVGELLETVFKVRRMLDAHAALVGVATLLFIVLVLLLSFRLRRAERQTMFKIGCGRGLIVWLHATELAIMTGFSLLLTAVLTAVALRFSALILQWLLQ